MSTDYPDIPILDSHIHLDPGGDPENAVKRFLSGGGTHLVVVHKPYHDIEIKNIQDYERSFRRTLKMSELANNLGAKAQAVIGPYPVELVKLSEKMGLENAKNLQIEALDTALEMVDEGEALGLGEIGRVHFPVDATIQNACDEILTYAFKGCRVRRCPAILHTESPERNQDLMKHLFDLVRKAGADPVRVVKHFSQGKLTDPDLNKGLSVSILAHKKNLKYALCRDNDFLMETDYIDSLERPDVVLPPDMVPKKIRWAYRASMIDEEKHFRLMVDHPLKVLGFDTN